MKRLFNFVALTAMMLMVSVNVLAQPANLYTAQKINGNTATGNRSVAPTRTDGSKYYFDIDASTSDTEIWFVFCVDGWGDKYLHAYNNGDAPGTTYNIASDWGQSASVPSSWFRLTTTGYSKITICIDLTYNSSIGGYNFTTTYSHAGGDAGEGEYYFVSPELTGGQLLESYKFSCSRQRNGGSVLAERPTFNLPDFYMDANHANVSEITYYIINKTTGKEIRPASNNYVLGSNGTTNDKNQGKGTTWENYENTTNSGSNLFKLTRGTGVSYTFFVYTPTSNVEFLANSAYAGTDGVSASGYYLSGNFEKASADNIIKPWTTDGRREMTKYWYLNGVEYTEEPATAADSIVYRVTVPRPAEGWDNLYLAVFDKNTVAEWQTQGDPASDSNMGHYWHLAIRPQVQWRYSTPGGSVVNDGLDATALHGGLFTRKDGCDNTQQALNPQLSAAEKSAYTSYTFSMNITNSTYRINFNSDLYIMGPAVNTSASVSGDAATNGWDRSSLDQTTDHAIKMTFNATDKSYTLRVNDDVQQAEKPVYLIQGQPFAFAFNKSFNKTIFVEDDVVPVDLSNTTAANTEADVYRLADNDKGNQDTQYVNFLKETTTGTADHNSGVNDITFNLPTGEYFIRLYVRAANPETPDNQQVYYLLKRANKFYNPKAKEVTALTAGNQGTANTFKSFCDYHAVTIPTDIMTAYIVTAADKSAQTVTVQKLPVGNPDIYGGYVIPANTPVLLAMKTDQPGTTGGYAYTHYFDYDPAANLQPTAAQKRTALPCLEGQITRTHIEPTAADHDNFLFGFNTFEGDDQPTVGFFVPGAGQCSINTAYLKLEKDFLDGANHAKGWTLVVALDEDENMGVEDQDEPVVPALPEEVVVDGMVMSTVTTEDQGAYYTLQGVRVAQPTKGFYIHNGKKVIIK